MSIDCLYLVLLVVVIVTGWVTTMYSNFKEEDNLINSKEPVRILVVADVNNNEAHNKVVEKLFNYLKKFGGVDTVYYVKDVKNGPKSSESIKTWWMRALKDSKIIKDGCVLFVPGPPRKQETVSEDQDKYREAVNIQMSLLAKEGEDFNQTNKQTQFNLNTAINQRRIIIVKFPYSDMNNLPSQVIILILMRFVILFIFSCL